MYKQNSLAGGVLAAGFLAGPLVVLTTSLASLYLTLPRPVPLDPVMLAPFALALLLSLIPGTPVGLIVNALGAQVMRMLADYFAWARTGLGWAIAGGLLGLGLAWMLDFARETPEILFGLVATSAICGWVCQSGVDWSVED